MGDDSVIYGNHEKEIFDPLASWQAVVRVFIFYHSGSVGPRIQTDSSHCISGIWTKMFLMTKNKLLYLS